MIYTFQQESNFNNMGLFFQTIGSSLKLLPAAVWDELHIFLTSFHKIKWPTNIALQLLLFWKIGNASFKQRIFSGQNR